MYGEGRESYRVLVGKPEEKRPRERPRSRRESNMRIDLQEVGWEPGMDLCGSGQVHVAGFCKCGNEPSASVKSGEFLDQLRTCCVLKKDSAPWSQLFLVGPRITSFHNYCPAGTFHAPIFTYTSQASTACQHLTYLSGLQNTFWLLTCYGTESSRRGPSNALH